MSSTGSTPMRPATHRGRRRREAVLDAAARLFHENGFHGTSMDDLGAAAGISGPGLYRHFASKDALLMAVLDRFWARLAPAVDAAADAPPGDALERLLDAHLDLVLDQPHALVVLVRELRHLPDDYRQLARRNHRRYLAAWVDALRGVHPHLDVEVARTVALGVHGVVDSVMVRPEGLPPRLTAEQQRRILRTLASGVLEAGARS